MTRILCMAILALGGCSTFNTATSTVDMTALSKSAYTAKSTYAGLLIVAVAYNQRPPCGGTVVICRDPVVVEQIRKASVAADAGTQAAENAVRSLGSSPLVVQAAVTAATQSVAAFKVVTDTFGSK
jgi:hypothetical protein